MPTPSTFERPLQLISGDRYALSPSLPPVAGELMPQEANKVHWYFALAVDKTGNWDRVPSPAAGNYAYFQETFDICSVKPQKPAAGYGRRRWRSGIDAIVTWCTPEAYTNGDPIAADDTVHVRCLLFERRRRHVGGGPERGEPASRSYTHHSLSAGTYIYRVRARSSCMTCTSCASGLCCSDYSTDTASVTIP